GHRAAAEIDAGAVRYREAPKVLLDIMLNIKKSGDDPQVLFEKNRAEREDAFHALHKKLMTQDTSKAAKFAAEYRFFSNFGGYRETHKTYLVYIVDILRQKVKARGEALASAGRLDSPEQAFELTV